MAAPPKDPGSGPGPGPAWLAWACTPMIPAICKHPFVVVVGTPAAHSRPITSRDALVSGQSRLRPGSHVSHDRSSPASQTLALLLTPSSAAPVSPATACVNGVCNNTRRPGDDPLRIPPRHCSSCRPRLFVTTSMLHYASPAAGTRRMLADVCSPTPKSFAISACQRHG